MDSKTFQRKIWQFYRTHKRDFPWRTTHDPYRILVSEVMLQQTQTERVVPYYTRWLKLFPTFRALARARQADVLKAWQGLGYNRRALALKRCADQVVHMHRGKLPRDVKELQNLPGIGPYTAAALCVFAFDMPVPMIETNIRRVYLQYFFPRRHNVPDAEVLMRIEKTMDHKHPREWFYALMDYGALLPKLLPNANRRSRHYAKQSKFEGSHRQVRGAVLKILSEGPTTLSKLNEQLAPFTDRLSKALSDLKREQFIKTSGKYLMLA